MKSSRIRHAARGKRESKADTTRKSKSRLPLSRGDLLLAAAIVAMVVAAYFPAFHAGFIWDDDAYVTENPLITAPDGLQRIWFSLDSPSQYFPLVYTSFRIEHAVWGFNPLGYHAINILLHIVNALLIWALLTRLAIPGAWLAAAIWAVHPVQVESVVWITERKNVLSTLFYLLSLLAWNRVLDKPEKPRASYAMGILCGALALFAKTTACTIPVVMLIMVWWRRERIDKKRLLQVAPFAMMSLLMGLVTVWWERSQQGTVGEIFAFPPIERVLIAGRAVWFYLEKLILPRELAFSYPRWNIDPGSVIQYIPLAALITVAVALWIYRRKARAAIGAGLFFVFLLAPMLGLISLWTFRYTFVADHYQYFACLGPIALFTAAVSRLGRRDVQAALAVVIIGVLGALSFHQSLSYKSEETVWNDVLKKNPRSSMALNNLGKILYDGGHEDEAMRLVQKAIDIDERNSEAHLNMGVALYARERFDEAAEQFEQAVRWLPNYARAHRELCAVLKKQGLLDDAIEHGEKSVELNPDDAMAQVNLGSALASKGRLEEAMEHFRTAVRIAPELAPAHYNLGTTLMALGRIDGAISEYEQAIQLDPTLSQGIANLAVLLYTRHNYEKAWRMVWAARRLGQPINPDFLEALSKKMPDPGG